MITEEFKEALKFHNRARNIMFRDYVIETSEENFTVRYGGNWPYYKEGKRKPYHLYKVVKGETPTEESEDYIYVGIFEYEGVKELVPVKQEIPTKLVRTRFIPKEDINDLEWELII